MQLGHRVDVDQQDRQLGQRVDPQYTVTLGIRPEGLHIDPGGTIPARVSLVERLGGLTLLHVIAEGDQEMTVQIEGSDRGAPPRANSPRGRSVRMPSVRQGRSGSAAP